MGADYASAVAAHLVDLLHVGGVLAGLIETIPGADHLLIENIAVAPAFQGQGHGRFLMRHAEALAAGMRLDELRLYTNQLFRRNVELYLRLGYRIEREEPFQGGVVVHMTKRLA